MVALIAILLWAPSVYGQVAQRPLTEGSFLVAILALIAILAAGVVRRWRWTFWLIVVAFLAGALRVPASVLELAGVLQRTAPTWYVILQAVIGAVQLAIGIALLKGYRNAGVWGAF
ncbi:MAG TPA: hypothetical protein VFR33_01330 [Candidatus Dormibacteraeota bacterium]|nr:hypothetical protein [Candidatus Dormibacteraeota bacterium]